MKKSPPILYYTDPLKALWMQQNHNVKLYIYEMIPSEIASKEDLGQAVLTATQGVIARTFIHPDSLHIFKPEEWDVIVNDSELYNDGEYPFHASQLQIISEELYNAFKADSIDGLDLTTDVYTLKDFNDGYCNNRGMRYVPCKIIQRENKQFFMPEIEGDVS